MGIQGALIEVKLSLKLLKSFSTEVDWCLVSAVQLRQLKSNLTQALFHLREKPQPGQLSAPGEAPNVVFLDGRTGRVSDCPITPSPQRKRMKLMAAECFVNEVPIEEAIDIWDQPDLDDSTLSEPLEEPGDEPSLSEPSELLTLQADPSVSIAMPTCQTQVEPVANPYLTVSPKLKDLLLWLNAQPLCHRAQDPPLPPNFQVLKGQTPQYYGLYPSKRGESIPAFPREESTPRPFQERNRHQPFQEKNRQRSFQDRNRPQPCQEIRKFESTADWRYHLTFLLLKLPHFRHNHSIFFASIFHQSSTFWRIRLITSEKIVLGKRLSASDAKSSPQGKEFLVKVQIPLVENQINLGLSSSDLECLRQQEEQANQEESKLALPLPLEENHNDLPEIGHGIVEVEMLKTFGTLHFYACKRCLLPAMKSEGCIGLMGLVKTGEDSLKGRMIVRHWQSPSSNPDQELSNLTNLISQVFGLPRLAIFKWSEMVPEGEGKTFTECWTKHKRESMASKNNQQKVEAALETMSDYGKHLTHVDVHELSFGSKHVMELDVVEDLPWGEIKNMALVMRKSLTGRLGLKPLLSQDCMDKFLAQARSCPKIENNRLTHPQFCRSMLEVFKCLANVRSKNMVTRFPSFGREFREIRSLWNIFKNVDLSRIRDSQDVQSKSFLVKQCEYCGKTITCFTAGDNMALAGHTRKCKLRRTACACGIAFSSAKDRQKHMLLKHSNGTCMKCDQCRYLTQDQKAMDNHVEHYHGFPGREEVCSLCMKSFRCRNHLNHHQFTHESHFCTPCGQEFLGRLPFRRHMKSEHGAGFPCKVCGKVILTQAHMAKHLKLKHSNA